MIKPAKLLFVICCMVSVSTFSATSSSEFRWGVGVGFGGSGITETTEVLSQDVTVQRSEGPGVFVLFGEKQLSGSWSLGLEHSRGFRLAPFTSGIHFTGANMRWYPLSPAPMISDSEEVRSLILYKEYVPFIGGSFGIAQGIVNRQDDLVPNLSTSGVYWGIRGGFDYVLKRDLMLRGEISGSSTIASSPSRPSSLTEFSMRVAWLFPF